MSRKKAFLSIFILVLLLLLVDYAFYAKKKDDSSALLSSQRVDEEASHNFVDKIMLAKINRIKEQSPSEWKLYSNKDVGVEFNYPSYYDLYSDSGQNRDYRVWVTFSHLNDDFVPRIYFVVSSDDIEEIIRNFSSYTVGEPVGEISGDYTIYRMDTVKDKEKMALITLGSGNDNFIFMGEEEDVLDKIISTLKRI